MCVCELDDTCVSVGEIESESEREIKGWKHEWVKDLDFQKAKSSLLILIVCSPHFP